MPLQYPKDVPHPNGFRTVTVYSPEEERSVQSDFVAFREEHRAAGLAAIHGKPAPTVVDAKVRAEADMRAAEQSKADEMAKFNAAVEAEVQRRTAAKKGSV